MKKGMCNEKGMNGMEGVCGLYMRVCEYMLGVGRAKIQHTTYTDAHVHVQSHAERQEKKKKIVVNERNSV